MSNENLSAKCQGLAAHLAATPQLLDDDRKAKQPAVKRARRHAQGLGSEATHYVDDVVLTVFALAGFHGLAPAARYWAHASK